MLKKLNKEKILETDFIDRFLGFVERYDDIYDTNHSIDMEGHIASQNFYSIHKFIKPKISDSINFAPFSIKQFLSMSIEEIIHFQEYFSKIYSLIDEKKALYEEFLSFYE